MRQLPPPINGTEEYLRAIYERQGEVLEELKGLRAEHAPQQITTTVELKEPKATRTKASK